VWSIPPRRRYKRHGRIAALTLLFILTSRRFASRGHPQKWGERDGCASMRGTSWAAIEVLVLEIIATLATDLWQQMLQIVGIPSPNPTGQWQAVKAEAAKRGSDSASCREPGRGDRTRSEAHRDGPPSFTCGYPYRVCRGFGRGDSDEGPQHRYGRDDLDHVQHPGCRSRDHGGPRRETKTLARDSRRGNHHHAATLTRHPDCRALPTWIVAL
jgi:hypothetical protein